MQDSKAWRAFVDGGLHPNLSKQVGVYLDIERPIKEAILLRFLLLIFILNSSQIRIQVLCSEQGVLAALTKEV